MKTETAGCCDVTCLWLYCTCVLNVWSDMQNCEKDIPNSMIKSEVRHRLLQSLTACREINEQMSQWFLLGQCGLFTYWGFCSALMEAFDSCSWFSLLHWIKTLWIYSILNCTSVPHNHIVFSWHHFLISPSLDYCLSNQNILITLRLLYTTI